MPEKKMMICPDCGVAMNLHAEKVDYAATPVVPGAVDPLLGGVVVEAHTCPECGQTLTREEY